MKLNGASKVAGVIIGFITLIVSTFANGMLTRDRLTKLEATAAVEFRSVNEKVDSLKVDVLRRIERTDDKLDTHIREFRK